MKTIIATVSILSKDRQINSLKINKILSDYSYIISSRMGLNVQKKCTSNCLGLIILAVEGKKTDLNKLVNSLKKVKDLELDFKIFN